MALDTYANLQLSVLAWLARDGESDATTRCPDWITLAEDELRSNFSRLKIRYGETKNAAFSLSTEYTDLPSGFIALRYIRLNTADNVELEYISPQVAERDYGLISVSGRPKYYTIVGTQIRVLPAPDATYTATLVYYSLPALSGSNTTNWLLTNHPKVYLGAVLAEAYGYYQAFDKVQMARADVDRLIEAMRTTDDAANQGSSMQMRVKNTP